jgi:hypothetical protein
MRRNGDRMKSKFKHEGAAQLKRLASVSLARGRPRYRQKCADSCPGTSENRNRSISLGGVLLPVISSWLSQARPRTLTGSMYYQRASGSRAGSAFSLENTLCSHPFADLATSSVPGSPKDPVRSSPLEFEQASKI